MDMIRTREEDERIYRLLENALELLAKNSRAWKLVNEAIRLMEE